MKISLATLLLTLKSCHGQLLPTCFPFCNANPSFIPPAQTSFQSCFPFCNVGIFAPSPQTSFQPDRPFSPAKRKPSHSATSPQNSPSAGEGQVCGEFITKWTLWTDPGPGLAAKLKVPATFNLTRSSQNWIFSIRPKARTRRGPPSRWQMKNGPERKMLGTSSSLPCWVTMSKGTLTPLWWLVFPSMGILCVGNLSKWNNFLTAIKKNGAFQNLV